MSGVPGNVDHRVIGQVGEQSDRLHGHKDDDQAKAKELQDRFGRLKREYCPRCWAN